MATFDDFAVRPFLKADSGAFGGDLKMPLLVGQPGRRPGDMCLDDVAGTVRVRRGDQSVLNLGGAAGAPTWAQTVAMGSNSGATVTVDGDIIMSQLAANIITTSANLSLFPSTGIITLAASALNFTAAGTISSVGSLTLTPTGGAVDVNSATLAFPAAASIQTTTGDLTVSALVGNLHLTGASSDIILSAGGFILINSVAPTINTVSGPLHLNSATSNIIIDANTVTFPDVSTTFALPGGSDLLISATAANSTVTISGVSGPIPADFILNNALFISSGDTVTFSAPVNCIPGSTVGCTSVSGEVAVTITTGGLVWAVTVNFPLAFTNSPHVNFSLANPNFSPGPIPPYVSVTTTGFTFTAFSPSPGTTGFNYSVIGWA